jgi:hypothetical protein
MNDRRPLWTVAKCNWSDTRWNLNRDDVLVASSADMTLLLGMADALNTGGQENAAQSALSVLSMSLGNPCLDVPDDMSMEEALVRYALARISELQRTVDTGLETNRAAIHDIRVRQMALDAQCRAMGSALAAKDAALESLRAQFVTGHENAQDGHDIINAALAAGLDQ